MFPFAILSLPEKIRQVILSDSISRPEAGFLVGTQTDSYKGGQVKTWEGNANVVTTVVGTDQQGYARSPGTAFHSTTVNAGVSDCSMSLEIVEMPSLTTFAVNATIDFRKAQASTGDCYRLSMRGDGTGGGRGFLHLCKRVGGTVTNISARDVNVVPGDIVRIDIKGETIEIFVNDILQITQSDSSITTGTFYGFSSATSTTENAYSLRNLIITEI